MVSHKPLPPNQEPAENIPIKEFVFDVEEDANPEPDGKAVRDVEQDF